jgi:hypothetical protein
MASKCNNCGDFVCDYRGAIPDHECDPTPIRLANDRIRELDAALARVTAERDFEAAKASVNWTAYKGAEGRFEQMRTERDEAVECIRKILRQGYPETSCRRMMFAKHGWDDECESPCGNRLPCSRHGTPDPIQDAHAFLTRIGAKP